MGQKWGLGLMIYVAAKELLPHTEESQDCPRPWKKNDDRKPTGSYLMSIPERRTMQSSLLQETEIAAVCQSEKVMKPKEV